MTGIVLFTNRHLDDTILLITVLINIWFRISAKPTMSVATKKEAILAIVPGETPETRIVLVSRDCECERPILLRNESFSEGVGWFVQSQLELTRAELAQLRSVLGGKIHHACQQTSRKMNEHRKVQRGAFEQSEPVILKLHPVAAAS